jgi:hypothetical protein
MKNEHANARRLCESCVLREYFYNSFVVKSVSMMTMRYLPNYK